MWTHVDGCFSQAQHGDVILNLLKASIYDIIKIASSIKQYYHSWSIPVSLESAHRLRR